MLHSMSRMDTRIPEAFCHACKRVVDIVEHRAGEWRCGVAFRAGLVLRERYGR